MSPLAARATRIALRLFLAHHPLCSVYREDVVHVRGVGVCMGCLVLWPSLIVATAAWLTLPALFEPTAMLAIGLVLGLPYAVSLLVVWSRYLRVLAKVIGAVGLAATLVALPRLRLGTLGISALLVVGTLGILGLLAVRLRRILATCRACPYAMDWEACPGMLGHGQAPEPPAYSARLFLRSGTWRSGDASERGLRGEDG